MRLLSSIHPGGLATLSLAILLFTGIPAHSQTATDSAPQANASDNTGTNGEQDASIVSAPAELAVKLQEAGVQHEIALMRHGEEAFQWQLWSSKVLFWVVIALVVAGITFAAIQFGVGLARREPTEADEPQLSLEGLKVRSRFLGVITLTISLAFFYLYLTTVYPLKPIDVTAKPSDSTNQ